MPLLFLCNEIDHEDLVEDGENGFHRLEGG